ncbi:MAG: hypothetical protein KDB23_24950, partial [Planctomycetales bacterium]|nr:hypothetical protein [Planctomycetales bacterium]
MAMLTQAHRELFRREPDECFSSLVGLARHCQAQKEASLERWHSPQEVRIAPNGVDRLLVDAGNDGELSLSSWSFGQLCRYAGVGRDTVNRLTASTAAQVFAETLPSDSRPMQLLTTDNQIRSIHGTAYTRLFNADLLSVVREFAVDFEAPPVGLNGSTGLYAGEQDMFCFLIDPTGWTEIEGQAFAPGFFLWNSEV